MFVSGIQQSDSVIHIHVSILFQVLFPFRLFQNIEQSSLCYTVGPCWLVIYFKYLLMFLFTMMLGEISPFHTSGFPWRLLTPCPAPCCAWLTGLGKEVGVPALPLSFVLVLGARGPQTARTPNCCQSCGVSPPCGKAYVFFFFLIYFIYLFIYFWLCWVFGSCEGFL